MCTILSLFKSDINREEIGWVLCVTLLRQGFSKTIIGGCSEGRNYKEADKLARNNTRCCV